MARKRMSQADKEALVELCSRNSLSEIMRQVMRISARRKPGRPLQPIDDKLANAAGYWALVEIQRDGRSRGAKRATIEIEKFAQANGRKTSSSTLAKAHSKMERARKINPRIDEALLGIKDCLIGLDSIGIALGLPPLAPISRRKPEH